MTVEPISSVFAVLSLDYTWDAAVSDLISY